VLQADFGDAPASYGAAGAIYNPQWNGGALTPGQTTNVSTDAFTLATPGAPAIQLGSQIDSEADQVFSPDADADDLGGTDDEDAMGPLDTISVVPGGQYSLPAITCTGTGFIAGWIDWNRNGTFDEGERSETTRCAGGTATLTWTVPMDEQGGASFVRLRTASTPDQLVSPIGITVSGEVEDHPIALAAPAITIVKSADTEELVVGETVTFSFVVTNSGNVPLTDVAVVEGEFTGAGDLSAVDCPADRTLAPGAQLVCTATYVVQQADVDAEVVSNTATATGVPPIGGTVESPPSTVQTPSVPQPAITLVKSADTEDLVVGDTVDYTFRVTNTGNVTLSGVTVAEGDFTGAGDLSAVECPDTVLSPGEFVDCTATYVVQQADVDAGSVTNTATATGVPPAGGDPIESDPSTVTLTSDAAPAITIVKTADADELVVGETVTYSFLVKNTGNVSLSDVTVAEGEFSGAGDLSAIDCPATTLAPGADFTCAATYVVQQADVDAGSVTNTATASGTPPTGDPVDSPPSTVEIPSTPAPAITLVKSSDTDELVVGETVTYSFLVKNTGNVSLSDVAVAEGEFSGAGDMSAIDCPATTLAPGADFTCTATYVVQQADVDAGTITNTATATGTPPTGDPVDSPPSTVEIPSTADPSITIVKSSDTTDLVLGDTVTFSFVVTNTGNVTLSDVAVVEGEFSGAGDISAIDCPADRTLEPGAQLICSATYVVQQADVDSGEIENSATATGTPPTGGTVESPPSTVQVPSDPNPAITLVKTADTEDLVAGATVTYGFRVTNTGNVTLSDVTVAEGDFTGAGDLSAVECSDTVLSPGEFVDCTATYVVQQADVDAGSVTNTATATGTPPGGGDPIESDPSTVEITSTSAPAITIVKTADADELVVGETVTYSFLVKNTGNVSLSDVTVAEGEFSGAGDVSAIDCPATVLAPGADFTCTATYVVQQADVDAGSVTNTATATGTPPTGDPVDSPPSTVEIPSTPAPAITLVKTADREDLVAGEMVTYTFRVTNTGNVTLSGIGVREDAFSGAGDLSAVACPDTALAPGASLDCTATYVVQQADVDAGTVTNTATATGTPPGGGDPVESDPSTVTIDGVQTPSISIVKSADRTDLVLGETVTFSFVVTNTGNVTVSDVAVAEGEFTGAGELSALECPADRTLAPGAQLICSAAYVVQQADVDAGTVSNSATATGTPPGGGDPIESPPSTVEIPSTVAPAITIVKSADTDEVVLGETVTYTFHVTNTGNVTLAEAAVVEGDFTGAGTLSKIVCPDDRTLVPGESMDCTATYAPVQADVDAGVITNTATATGNPPGGDPVGSDPSTVEIHSSPAPAISIVKTSDTSQAHEGATVTYSFLVTNTGNVTLADVAVQDDDFNGSGRLSAIDCPADRTLAPGAQLTCTATYVVQKADVVRGDLDNTAIATGTPPGAGDPITSDPSTVRVTVTNVLPQTGGLLPIGAIGTGLLLLLVGLGLHRYSRSRRENAA
ncbi:MAG TPA: GEVED domain-containing protein, partial [Microbacterium sp.]|nr:GEVED domain-containing protein [Microbacterium sp.]